MNITHEMIEIRFPSGLAFKPVVDSEHKKICSFLNSLGYQMRGGNNVTIYPLKKLHLYWYLSDVYPRSCSSGGSKIGEPVFETLDDFLKAFKCSTAINLFFE